MNVDCVKHQVLLNIEPVGVRVSRCCRFFQSANESNCIFLSFDELQIESDFELVNFIIEKANEYPSKFRDLKYGVEKRCTVPCWQVYDAEPHSITISMPGCNLSCVMCEQGEIHPSQEMTYIYKRLLSAFSNDGRFCVAPTVSGEPFLYKKETLEFIKNCKKNTWITSNMTLLNDDDIEFLKSYRGKLIILASIDSLNEEVYRSIRRKATHEMFERAIKNTESLAAAGIVTGINCTIVDQNLNFDLIEEVIQWAKRLGVKMNLAQDSGRPELLSNPIIQKIDELHKGEDIWRI